MTATTPLASSTTQYANSPPSPSGAHSLSAAPAPASNPLASVDALRGFDMVWIIAATMLVRACRAMNSNPLTDFLARQLEHSPWDGFTFFDLIFPLFVFIVGVSSVFSLTKQIQQSGRRAAVLRLIRR